MSKTKRRLIGDWGENLAEKYYVSLGFEKICKNFLTKHGELDLVLKKGEEILIVEVKTRRSQKFGWPEETVTEKKLKNILLSYQQLKNKLFLKENPSLELCIIESYNNRLVLRRYQLL